MLCLHGFGNDDTPDHALSIRLACSALFAALPDFEFVIPPHAKPWWRAKPVASDDERFEYVGLEDSLQFLREFAAADQKANGAYDGLLGFSQGAMFVSLLLGMGEQSPLVASTGRGPHFGLLFSGMLPRVAAPQMQSYLKEPIAIGVPTLHIFGIQDVDVTYRQSISLARQFDPMCTQLMQHGGGHEVAKEPRLVKDVVRFVENWTKASALTVPVKVSSAGLLTPPDTDTRRIQRVLIVSPGFWRGYSRVMENAGIRLYINSMM